ncbi:hypothetical protein MSHI_04890 [Mycobacterium shinjukuense]|uniref:Uncharacterized protein n=1 Tax=Mycobacterium shinjukuense TaxID=398694 RepID=A0A7I7MM44_9MYCO|nr:hypothetical protein MSHI_04890 [Mycobacterium shinjukuense]
MSKQAAHDARANSTHPDNPSVQRAQHVSSLTDIVGAKTHRSTMVGARDQHTVSQRVAAAKDPPAHRHR